MKHFFIGLLFLGIIGCAPQEKPLAGSDRDLHGCIGSAGYTFSTVKNACIRLWEEGKPLLPVRSEGAVLAAYVIMGDGTAEVFLPKNEQPLQLVAVYQNERPQWETTDGSGWKLTADDAGGWELLQNDTLLYRTAQPNH